MFNEFRMLPKHEAWHQRLISFLVPYYAEMWTTWNKVIYYPNSVREPLAHTGIILHEKVHIAQQEERGWWLFLIMYLVGYWRLKFEAEAYAVNIKRKEWSVDGVVDLLKTKYFLWLYPRSYIRKAIHKYL